MRMSARRMFVRLRPRTVPAIALVGLLLLGGAGALLLSPHPGSDRGVARAPIVPLGSLAASDLGWTGLPLASSLSPPLRSAGALAYDAADGYLLLFGGLNRHLGWLGDTWKYEGGAWTNLTPTLTVAPSPRQGAAMTFDGTDAAILLVGGSGPSGALADTWSFAHGAWQLLTPSGGAPPARSGAGLAYVPSLRGAVMFGGAGADGTVLADTWFYAQGTWTQRTGSAELPPARTGGGLTFDASDAYAVLFGGTGVNGTYLNDTWTFSSAGWSPVVPPTGVAPIPRGNLSLTFDPARSAVLLFGGWDGTALSDTWAFSGGAWSPLTVNLSSSPGARYGAVAAFDDADGYLVLFGGVVGAGHYSTWLLLSPLAVGIAPATNGPVAPGAPATFTAELAGGLAPFNVTWQFGDGSAPATGTSVTHTFVTSGSYTVVLGVADGAGEFTSATLSVAVHLVALTVTIAADPATPTPGAPLTFSAAVSGGVAPYTYAWSAPAGVCQPSVGPTLHCAPVVAGAIEVGVVVTDTSAQRASTTVTVTATGGASGAGVRASPASTPALVAAVGGWAVLVPLLVALVGAWAGLLLYVAGRRRTRRLLGTRPLCYAVPAWSETPAEFRDDPVASEAVHR